MTDPIAICSKHGEYSLHTGCIPCQNGVPKYEDQPGHIGSRHHIDEEMGGHHGEHPDCLRSASIAAADIHEGAPVAGVEIEWAPGGILLRDYTSAERKTMPVHKGVMRYFPDSMVAVARVSFKGNIKHNGPDVPLEWSRGKSTDHEDCIARHLLTPDAVDPDSGELELAHAAWRALAALQLAEERRLVAAGIRPLSGVIPK